MCNKPKTSTVMQPTTSRKCQIISKPNLKLNIQNKPKISTKK